MKAIRFVAAAAALTLAQGAVAATLLNDDFSGDAPALSVTSLANFSVAGTVDVVGAKNPYGIVTSKNVVDLDGTPGPGALTSNSFAFGKSSRVTLTFVLGGAQRGSIADQFKAGFTFGDTIRIKHYTLGGSFGAVDDGTYDVSSIANFANIAGAAPFQTYSLSFISTSANSLRINIGTDSADNIGPLLSNVRLDVAAVPEPASWALMIAGFGLVGVAARRRRFAAA